MLIVTIVGVTAISTEAKKAELTNCIWLFQQWIGMT
jgi:hypothetical protein